LDRQVLSTDLAVWTINRPITNYNIIYFLHNYFCYSFKFFYFKNCFYFLWPGIIIELSEHEGVWRTPYVGFVLWHYKMIMRIEQSVGSYPTPRRTVTVDISPGKLVKIALENRYNKQREM